MGQISKHSITIPPAICTTQADICGPFKAYSLHHKRIAIKIWLIVYCCISTSTTNIEVIDGYSTQDFIQSIFICSCEFGHPKLMFIDEGNQLVKYFENMEIRFTNVRGILYKDMVVEFKTCSVGGHNFHCKVERRIRHVKESTEKWVCNQGLSIKDCQRL